MGTLPIHHPQVPHYRSGLRQWAYIIAQKLKAFWKSCAEFPIEYFYYMFTRCQWCRFCFEVLRLFPALDAHLPCTTLLARESVHYVRKKWRNFKFCPPAKNDPGLPSYFFLRPGSHSALTSCSFPLSFCNFLLPYAVVFPLQVSSFNAVPPENIF